MREELKIKVKKFNENHNKLEEYLEKKNMFLCGVSKNFKTFPIFEGKGINDPNNKMVGYANNMCEIDSIIWNR